MDGISSTFDSTGNSWQQWQDSPWGRLRYVVAEANLNRHLADLATGPAQVIDLGGGDGGDAIRLANAGHHVTIVDISSEMLAKAKKRANTAGVSDRVSCVQADIRQLPPELAQNVAGVVLCHNVLQYVDDVPGALAAALGPLRTGGVVSVMAINQHSAPLVSAIRQLNPRAALAALDTNQARTVTFNTTVTLHTADYIGKVMAGLDCPVRAHYGIRSVCDYIVDDTLKYDPDFYADLERLELAMTNREPYAHTARLFQLVGQLGIHPAASQN